VTLDEYTIDSKRRGALILGLRRAIVSEFTAEDWREFGHLSGESDYIQRHDRLLRSLHWQDPDYGDCVLQALERFSRQGWDVVDQLINHPKLTSHLLKEIPNLSIFVRRELRSVKTEAPASLSSGDVVLLALNDAEHLMHVSGPVSAVDRLHTALHGYFKSLCVDGGHTVADDASLTALFKALRKTHPILKDLGSYDNDLSRVLHGFANAIDAINSLRNNGSIAHPSEDLLGEPEAHLAANATRTIFNYIQAKVGH
jgi:hypothetical protein